jgi:hypothetical protein
MFVKRMTYFITLVGVLLCGCISNTPNKVTLTARVEAVHLQAMHDYYDADRWATFDAVVFRILSPTAWNGTNLTIYCHTLDTNIVFKTVGDVFQFRIAEDYLGARAGSLFDGAIEQPTKIFEPIRLTDKPTAPGFQE